MDENKRCMKQTEDKYVKSFQSPASVDMFLGFYLYMSKGSAAI